ncbi:hypothetical protein [Asticcacaulis sp. YBE204]|uniref:hypothetical protein n=1 Tax=Asticcacaulis sp. YBE204 TaxID=1282363 RepID=UPI0003C3E1C9|nr:hypothetical protein [Asticcacaulis sp. YBE204]ESQ79900.1 hypothetical protein AEYBE204_08620 [Asticcacaulis sp. YBE204]
MPCKKTPPARWNELEPDAFGEAGDPLVRVMLGKLVIIRLNQIDARDEMIGSEIIAGKVVRANRAEGFVLSLVGQRKGEEFYLPLVPQAFKLIDPGDYGLSCGTPIRDPDFQAAFDIYANPN